MRVAERHAPLGPREPSPDEAQTANTKSKTTTEAPDPRVTALRDHYVAEYERTKQSKPVLTAKQWPRAMRSFKELLEATKELDSAKRIVTRAFEDSWHRNNKCQTLLAFTRPPRPPSTAAASDVATVPFWRRATPLTSGRSSATGSCTSSGRAGSMCTGLLPGVVLVRQAISSPSGRRFAQKPRGKWTAHPLLKPRTKREKRSATTLLDTSEPVQRLKADGSGPGGGWLARCSHRPPDSTHERLQVWRRCWSVDDAPVHLQSQPLAIEARLLGQLLRARNTGGDLRGVGFAFVAVVLDAAGAGTPGSALVLVFLGFAQPAPERCVGIGLRSSKFPVTEFLELGIEVHAELCSEGPVLGWRDGVAPFWWTILTA